MTMVGPYNVPGTVLAPLIPHHCPGGRVFPLSHYTAQEHSLERVGDTLTPRPTNSAAEIEICHSDFRIGARSLCHAVSSVPSPPFPPQNTIWKLGRGEYLFRGLAIASWLGLNNYTKGQTLALVSLLPWGWGGVWQGSRSLKGTPQCLLSIQTTLWLAEEAINAES